jgi:hypothetical protein
MPIPKTGALPLGYAPPTCPEDIRIEAEEQCAMRDLSILRMLTKPRDEISIELIDLLTV